MEIGIESARGFHRDMEISGGQPAGQRSDLPLQQRFSTSHHNMVHAGTDSLRHQIGDGTTLTLRKPGSVGRVAPPAAQIASRSSDEERRHAGQSALSLDAGEGLGYEHGVTVAS